jgi:hypothetical protein
MRFVGVAFFWASCDQDVANSRKISSAGRAQASHVEFKNLVLAFVGLDGFSETRQSRTLELALPRANPCFRRERALKDVPLSQPEFSSTIRIYLLTTRCSYATNFHPRSLRGVSGDDPEGGAGSGVLRQAARNRSPREARDPARQALRPGCEELAARIRKATARRRKAMAGLLKVRRSVSGGGCPPL